MQAKIMSFFRKKNQAQKEDQPQEKVIKTEWDFLKDRWLQEAEEQYGKMSCNELDKDLLGWKHDGFNYEDGSIAGIDSLNFTDHGIRNSYVKGITDAKVSYGMFQKKCFAGEPAAVDSYREKMRPKAKKADCDQLGNTLRGFMMFGFDNSRLKNMPFGQIASYAPIHDRAVFEYECEEAKEAYDLFQYKGCGN
ncbi:MAG: hypothetical protein ACHQIM_19895 [Sphingobacteriales bacterium]